MIQRPVAIGLMLVEQAIIEEGTRNVTLVNCFRRVRLPALPSSQNFAVFAALTNGRGRVVIDLAIDRLDTLDQIFHRSRTVEFRSPLQEVWILFHVSHGAFPVPGSYQVALRMQGEVIAQRVFEVLTTENELWLPTMKRPSGCRFSIVPMWSLSLMRGQVIIRSAPFLPSA